MQASNQSSPMKNDISKLKHNDDDDEPKDKWL